MNGLLVAPAIMTGIGLLFALLLALSARLLRVAEDPRVAMVEDLLPGSNCGACGEAGCHAFAEALARGALAPARCSVASPAAIEALAELLDVDPGQRQRRVARLHCAGGRAQAHQIAEYQGLESCAAAALLSSGGKGCAWGCMGLGDCQTACTFAAIQMNANGLPVVDGDRCTACGDCVGACPRELFELLPLDHHLLVQCHSPLAGEAALGLCRVACDACGRCAADAAPGLVRMRDHLPVVDYGAGGPARPEATYRCPTGAIQWVVGGQFQDGGHAGGARHVPRR